MSRPKFLYVRPVRFEDVDAARIVFFARFLNYCHEAMEAFYAPLDGGYARLVLERQIGVPAVHIEADFKSPLRYGDNANIAISVTKIGRTSCTFRYEFTRGDGAAVACVTHVVAFCDLVELRPIPIPADARALLERYLENADDRREPNA